jgi:hypothetical protein
VKNALCYEQEICLFIAAWAILFNYPAALAITDIRAATKQIRFLSSSDLENALFL